MNGYAVIWLRNKYLISGWLRQSENDHNVRIPDIVNYTVYLYFGSVDEFAEMEQIQADKGVFADLFDHIDTEDYGDVDEKEWIDCLKRLGVQILESDMVKLFSLMDGENSGYIDRQDWIVFCMSTYESPELQRLHDDVLNNVSGHSGQPYNIFLHQPMNQWTPAAINKLDAQLTKAFLEQGTQELEWCNNERAQLTDSYKDWNQLQSENKMSENALNEANDNIKDLTNENACLKLQTMADMETKNDTNGAYGVFGDDGTTGLGMEGGDVVFEIKKITIGN